jgi:Uncharacterised nucleotidyltransferase
MRGRRSRFLRLVRGIVEPSSLLVDPGWKDAAERHALFDMAELHRVAGQLANSYRKADVAVPERLAQLRQRAALRHLHVLKAMASTGQALDRAGVPWLVVKGPALAGYWYRDGTAREYHDLDLLVPPSSLATAVDALGEVGFLERNRNWTGLRAVGMGEVPLTDGRVTIDLHWSLVNFERERRQVRLDTCALLERRIVVQLGSVTAPTLSPEDTFAHLVLHTGLAGARLLVHLSDIHVVGAAIDWSAAMARLADLRLDRMAAVVIDRSERILGPLNAEPRAPSLGNDPWRAVNAAVDRLWGMVAPGAVNPLPSFLVAATREGTVETARQLQFGVGTSIRRRLGLPTLASPGGVLDWDVDAGGPGERARYFADVERGRLGQ